MINISITTDPSIDSVIKRIKDRKKRIEEQKNTFLERLANIGVEQVTKAFAKSDHVGENDASQIYAQKTLNGWSVVAFGANVLFIEFGTGLSAGEGYTENVNISISPWSYSSTEGTGEGAKYFSWHHKKHKYEYSTPAKGFIDAKAEILRQAPQIAKEIFV